MGSELDLYTGAIKPICGYEGLYSITSNGAIVSHGNKPNHKGNIIIKSSYDKDGYLKCTLQKNKSRRYYRVHRLVAAAFIPNPLNMPMVNHIDGNILNNNVSNLEWTDAYGNWKTAHRVKIKEIPVIQKSLDGLSMQIHKSLMDAARFAGINQGNITNCIRGRCKSVGGFLWEKVEQI